MSCCAARSVLAAALTAALRQGWWAECWWLAFWPSGGRGVWGALVPSGGL